MKDSRTSKSRLALRISSINRQLELLDAAEEDRKNNFENLTYRGGRTTGSSPISADYSLAKRDLTRLKEEYQARLRNGNYRGQPKSNRAKFQG